jgi:hypothetical protein
MLSSNGSNNSSSGGGGGGGGGSNGTSRLCECCVCLEELPLRKMEVCVFYVCGHFICTDCFQRMLAVDPPDRNGNKGFHLCPMCRTPILPEAGLWVAHSKEKSAHDSSQETIFFNTNSGESSRERPAGSERHWRMVQEEGDSHV